MSWYESPLAVLDLEATGVDPDVSRIIEVALFIVDTDGSSVSLVDELNGGKWKAVNISNDRRGQGRRSSTPEWVTLSTEAKR